MTKRAGSTPSQRASSAGACDSTSSAPAHPMKAKRASLTKKERAAMIERQGGLCFTFGCIGKPKVAEHWTPVALGNDQKPDCLLCTPCADAKTNGLRGDKSTIARTKRHRDGNTQFDKRKRAGGSRIKGRNTLRNADLKKKFSGEVVKRG